MYSGSVQWYQPTAGLSNVGSYQVSAIPWVTSSLSIPASSSPSPIVEVSFPSVTKFFIIKNETADHLYVAFSRNGFLNKNYFILEDNESFSAELRVTKLFLKANSTATSATIIAGLTGINADQLPTNWSGSIGVG